MYSSVDTIWVLFGAVLVFFMQPGFAMVETGLTRAKNAGNICMKNLMDFALGTVFFWIVGFGLMFGQDIHGVIGTPDFFVSAYQTAADAGYPAMAYLIFQTVFCATSATIVSGSMAERTKFSAYCLYSVLISLIIYPISGHWAWGGGWLSELGFHDFAGSTVVHMVGGILAFIGAFLLGPRIGKYNKDGSANAILGHSIPLACLGTFFLWFGWFGFNGASTVCATGDEVIESMSSIFVTTNLAAAAATCTVMCLTWLRYGHPDVSMTMNGALAGLVAITAGCDVVSPMGAFIIGVIAGVVVVFSVEFIDQKLHVADPVGAGSVHGVCGALGTILTGVFAVKDGLLFTGKADFLGIQVLGVAAVAIYVAIIGFVVFKVIDAVVGLRVSAEEEIGGLDSVEHGLPSAYASFLVLPDNYGEGAEYTEEPAAAVAAAPAAAPAAAESVAPNVAAAEASGISNVRIITSEERFDRLKDAMERIGITGMTVTHVQGYGIQKGHEEVYRGAKIPSRLRPKVQCDIVVSKIPPRTIINAAKKVLFTGKYGDGKIFVSPMENVVKIRTGEEGYDALQDKPL